MDTPEPDMSPSEPETDPARFETVSRSAVVRLAATTGGDFDHRLAGRALVDVLRRLDDLALVSFRIRSKEGRLTAGIVVESFDCESATMAATRIRLAAEALDPSMRFDVDALTDDDPLLLPSTPRWASRILKGEMSDEHVRAGSFSPVAAAMAKVDATLSIAVASSDGELVGDIVIVSDDGPTDVLAALMTAELNAESNITIESSHGGDAAALVATHHTPQHPVNVAVFGDVFSIPTRTDAAATWSRQPVVATDPESTVALLRSAPQLHRWLLGRTGMGKSTLMRHLIEADIDDGTTVVIIDPHGDLAESVARRHRRSRRLRFVDFAADEPPTLNPMLPEPGQSNEAVCDDFVSMIRSVWDDMPNEYFGPVFDRGMRLSLAAVTRHGHERTVHELVRFLQGDSELSESIAKRAASAGDMEIAQAIDAELGNLGRSPGDGGQASMSMWLVSKLQTLASDGRVARVVDTDESSLSIDDAIRAGSILSVRCPVGWLGLPATRMLSQIIISRLVGVAGRRFEVSGVDRRQPISVYIDEWALVAQAPIQRLLAEGRKYGLHLTIANQNLQQVDRPMQVAANVGSLALFRVGPQEASVMSEEFETIDPKGLRTLPPYHVAVRNPEGDEAIGRSPEPLGR